MILLARGAFALAAAASENRRTPLIFKRGSQCGRWLFVSEVKAVRDRSESLFPSCDKQPAGPVRWRPALTLRRWPMQQGPRVLGPLWSSTMPTTMPATWATMTTATRRPARHPALTLTHFANRG
jgi:hypothetical protein